MSRRQELENNLKRLTAEVADLKATIDKIPEDKKLIFIQKGDYMVGKRNHTGETRVFLVTYATPNKATLVCLTAGAVHVLNNVTLAKNFTIAEDALKLKGYTLDKVITHDQAINLI